MKYGDFKKECQKTAYGKNIFKKWMDGKLPLSWAIDIFILFKKHDKLIKNHGKKNTS